MEGAVSGLLIRGALVDVPGVRVLAPGDEPWVRLDMRDRRPRRAPIQQITIHTTKGLWPQPVIPGSGPGGKARSTADYWSIAASGTPGGAHLVVDDDGTIACLCDLALTEAYHATTVNQRSIGIEMFQRADGGVHEATLDATVKLVLVLCDAFGIPLQIDSEPYRTNTIIERLRHGGPDVVGVFGHRSNAWMFPEWLKPEKRATWPAGYADRGRGDPGDEIFVRLRHAGAQAFNFDARAELAWWMRVQAEMNKLGESLHVDGICGQRTVAAMKRHGLWPAGGIFAEFPFP